MKNKILVTIETEEEYNELINTLEKHGYTWISNKEHGLSEKEKLFNTPAYRVVNPNEKTIAYIPMSLYTSAEQHKLMSNAFDVSSTIAYINYTNRVNDVVILETDRPER